MLTGHADGLITLNIAEADHAERERRRMQLHEPYRTLLGHFRHEIGHYYWDLLIRDSERLQECRRLFGDDSVDYAAALQRHYNEGPPGDWQQHFVTSYASSHPWEDWAETWAHYLHMMDCLDTAAASGISLPPPRRGAAPLRLKAVIGNKQFDTLTSNWAALTTVLNNLNRSMGLADAYPFVLSDTALAKLRFVHEVVTGLDPEEGVRAPDGHPLFSGKARQEGVVSPAPA